jgi:feruloyl esterase
MLHRLACLLAITLTASLLCNQAAANTCAQLTALHLPGVTLSGAEARSAGPFPIPALGPMPAHRESLPAFCRVAGSVAPDIGFELWLPAHHWNGRLLAVGSGGFGGYIDFYSLAQRLQQGYAVTANDTGHHGTGLRWMHDPQALLAWGHDATHRVAGPVKRLVSAYYRSRPAHSYFVGCSTGGDQAMEEAEFYPRDFDGIVAESPGMDYSGLMLSFLWGLKASTANGPLSDTKLQLLHRFVMGQCDGQDGLKDGLLQLPLACHVSLAPLVCHGQDHSGCLTPGEVRTAELMYQGPRNPRTGAQIYPGFAPGSEADPAYSGPLAAAYGWSLVQGPLGRQYAIPLLANTVFGPRWDWKTFDFDNDVSKVEKTLSGKIDAMNPDLRPFAARGGKLIMVQGWGDPYNAQTLPIEYRNRVLATFAGSGDQEQAEQRVGGFYRLFMAPGMGHCLWGPGPSEVHALAALQRWVEKDEAPSQLIAARVTPPSTAAQADAMRRPLCPYPKYARFIGGNANVAADFRCKSRSARHGSR